FLFENDQSNINEFPSENCQNEVNDCQNPSENYQNEIVKMAQVIPESHSTFNPEQSASESLHNEYRGIDENINNNLIEEQIISKNYAFTHKRESEKCPELDKDGIIKHWIFECSFSEIRVTSIARDHNHALISDVHLYVPKFSESIYSQKGSLQRGSKGESATYQMA
ncbi:19183_t:CDS:2, partial [Gigaspora rosea]